MKISVFEGKRKENEAVKCEEKDRQVYGEGRI